MPAEHEARLARLARDGGAPGRDGGGRDASRPPVARVHLTRLAPSPDASPIAGGRGPLSMELPVALRTLEQLKSAVVSACVDAGVLPASTADSELQLLCTNGAGDCVGAGAGGGALATIRDIV
eukprot:328631-Prymnesium_polylepis.1